MLVSGCFGHLLVRIVFYTPLLASLFAPGFGCAAAAAAGAAAVTFPSVFIVRIDRTHIARCAAYYFFCLQNASDYSDFG